MARVRRSSQQRKLMNSLLAVLRRGPFARFRGHRTGQEIQSSGVSEIGRTTFRKLKHARQRKRVPKSSFLEASGGALARQAAARRSQQPEQRRQDRPKNGPRAPKKRFPAQKPLVRERGPKYIRKAKQASKASKQSKQAKQAKQASKASKQSKQAKLESVALSRAS